MSSYESLLQLPKDLRPTSVFGFDYARLLHCENDHVLDLHQEPHITMEVSIDRDFFPSGSEGLPPSVRDLLLFECGSRKIEDKLCEQCRGGTFHSTKITSAPSSLLVAAKGSQVDPKPAVLLHSILDLQEFMQEPKGSLPYQLQSLIAWHKTKEKSHQQRRWLLGAIG